MIRVIVETPFKSDTEEGFELNQKYLSAALKDCLQRGEAPFASHAIYTREGVLDDNIPEDRKWGIEAGFVWGEVADKTVVYTDRGISGGMQWGIKAAEEAGRPIEYRTIERWNE